jgi:hypothetical protein
MFVDEAGVGTRRFWIERAHAPLETRDVFERFGEIGRASCRERV